MKKLMMLVMGGILTVAVSLAADAVQKFFYCRYCGQKCTSVNSLTGSACMRHPAGKGRHALYEGSEKSTYICKYCGRKASDIRSLTASKCMRHPNGPAKGLHEPAL